MNKPLTKDIDQKQIDAWMDQFPNRVTETEIEIPIEDRVDERSEAKYYILRPDAYIKSALLKASKSNDVPEIEKVTINNCVLGGDMDLLEYDEIKDTLLNKVMDTLEPLKATSKKMRPLKKKS